MALLYRAMAALRFFGNSSGIRLKQTCTRTDTMGGKGRGGVHQGRNQGAPPWRRLTGVHQTLFVSP